MGEAGIDPAGVVVDGAGMAYIVGGVNNTTNYSTSAKAYFACDTTNDDAFVARFSADALFRTYFVCVGGSSSDQCSSIDINADGIVYITGYTHSSDFPLTQGGYNYSGVVSSAWESFASKIDLVGDSLVASTYFGGGGNDVAFGIVVDSFDDAYISGWTDSGTIIGPIPTTPGAYQLIKGGSADGFVVKIKLELPFLDLF